MLFGGQDALGRFLSDTWLFNRRTTCTKFGACLFGFVWTQATYPTGAAEPPPLNDTCVYNFDLPQWFGPNLPQTTRAARFGHGLAHYPVSGLRVLYGGQASTRRPGPRSCRRIPGMRHVTRPPTRGAAPSESAPMCGDNSIRARACSSRAGTRWDSRRRSRRGRRRPSTRRAGGRASITAQWSDAEVYTPRRSATRSSRRIEADEGIDATAITGRCYFRTRSARSPMASARTFHCGRSSLAAICCSKSTTRRGTRTVRLGLSETRVPAGRPAAGRLTTRFRCFAISRSAI